MTGSEMKHDAVLTVNWFRLNLPTIVTVVGACVYLGTWQTQIQSTLVQLQADNAGLKSQLQTMQNIPYRVDQSEMAIRSTNDRLDNLSNTIINQMDLIRRDVNRLTTQVEVLSSRVGLLTGDVDDPKQRRSRPEPSTHEAETP